MVVAQKMRGAQQLQHASSRVATAETVVSTGSRCDPRALARIIALDRKPPSGLASGRTPAAIGPHGRDRARLQALGVRTARSRGSGPRRDGPWPSRELLRATPVSHDAQFRAGKVEAMSLLEAAISNLNGTAGWAHSRRITLAAMRKVAV